MGWGAWALAMGAAPGLSLHDNYLEAFGLVVMLLAIISLPIPYIFKWDWKAKYFGATFFSLASGAIIGIYPILCIVQFSSLPLLARLTIALLEGGGVILWCSRFVRIYKIVYADKILFRCIYEEEPTAVYYMQQGDRKIINKLLKFEQFPKSKYVIFFLLAGLSLVPFASSVSKFVGVPFTHVFLAVSGTPLNLMFLGLATKMWLVCYFYPIKIRRETNKPVYVDMSSQPVTSINSSPSLDRRPNKRIARSSRAPQNHRRGRLYGPWWKSHQRLATAYR
jgi:hypothetical protein